MSIFEPSAAYRPFVYSWAVEAEKKQRIDMFWHEGQVDFSDDLRQFNNDGGLQTKNVSHAVNKNLIEKLIMLFTELDVSVGSNYAKILPHVQNNEIRMLLMTTAMKEVVHARGYALAAETFGFSNSDWSEFKKYKEMQDKLDIMAGDVDDLSKPFNCAKMFVVTGLGEGIALFGAFACLLNLRRWGLVQNFNVVNEWSLKDEQEHVINNFKIIEDIRKDLSDDECQQLNQYIRDMVVKYVEAELLFLDLVFEMGDQEGMTKQDAKNFIEYLGELRLYQLGLEPVETVRENPLDWIDFLLTGSTHSSFFEVRVVDYTHNGLEGDVDYNRYKASLDNRVV
jgi:ribonucleoside-diphosphate reductase beta chain